MRRFSYWRWAALLVLSVGVSLVHPIFVAALTDEDALLRSTPTMTRLSGVLIHGNVLVSESIDAPSPGLTSPRVSSGFATYDPALSQIPASSLQMPELSYWGPRWLATRAPANTPWFHSRSLGYGWPMASQCVDLETPLAPGLNATPSVVHGIDTGWCVVPTRAVPVGLAVNALVFAACVCVPALLVRIGLEPVLRRRHWARGVCGRCRYEVGDLERCPECGAERPGVREVSA